MRSVVSLLRNAAPISYVPNMGIQFPWMQRTDAEQQIKAFGRNGDLFAIVSRLAGGTSKVEWDLWRKAASGKDEDRTQVTDHQALRVWQQPNPYMTRQEYVETVQQHIDLTGEGWGIIGYLSKAASIPGELWPVRPDRIAPVPSPTDFIAGYMYTGPNGEQVPFDRTEVNMIRMPNPWDFYRGMGPVQAMLVDLDASRYSSEWNRNFFTNSAQPGGIIQVEKGLSDAEFKQMTTRWREQHQGVSNAHRVAVLEFGKWVDVAFSQRDMQFAELEQVASDKLLRAFGFPKFMLGEVSDVNRATAEASDAMFAQWLIIPRLERWKGMLNHDFLPLFGAAGKGLEFDYRNPVEPDQAAEISAMTAKAAAAKTYIADCSFTADSVKEALDLPDALVWEKPEPPPAPVIAPPAAPGAPVPPGQQDAGGEGSADATEVPGEDDAAKQAGNALLRLLTGALEGRARDDRGGHVTARFLYDDPA